MGFAEADITPQKPVELVGFFRPENWSKGILHPLKLQVILWKDSHRAGCLITVDSQRIKVLLLRVTAHANILSSDNYLISADYFGVTRERLERKLGCHVTMVQGAAGDIRPMLYVGKYRGCSKQ